MPYFTNLAGDSRSVWNATITEELTDAGIGVREVPGKNLPTYVAPYDVEGKIGDWTFSRTDFAYSFWGDVPLIAAEVIASDPEYYEGCMPGQWFPSWGNQSIPHEKHAELASHLVWIDENGLFYVTEESLGGTPKELAQTEAGGKLLVVEDPSESGKPFIQTYTFFTHASLKHFVEICKRHQVKFTYTYRWRW